MSAGYLASDSAATEWAAQFDVIVGGGGHAGCEAAITNARLGLNTALFSLNPDRIAWQPCNPAVGGPAKSQLVHEVDALGGVIGRLADATALQKRVLNASRGAAAVILTTGAFLLSCGAYESTSQSGDGANRPSLPRSLGEPAGGDGGQAVG